MALYLEINGNIYVDRRTLIFVLFYVILSFIMIGGGHELGAVMLSNIGVLMMAIMIVPLMHNSFKPKVVSSRR